MPHRDAHVFLSHVLVLVLCLYQGASPSQAVLILKLIDTVYCFFFPPLEQVMTRTCKKRFEPWWMCQRWVCELSSSLILAWIRYSGCRFNLSLIHCEELFFFFFSMPRKMIADIFTVLITACSRFLPKAPWDTVSWTFKYSCVFCFVCVFFPCTDVIWSKTALIWWLQLWWYALCSFGCVYKTSLVPRPKQNQKILVSSHLTDLFFLSTQP